MDAPYPGLTLGSYLIWVVLSSVLMLSLLLAIMSKSAEAHGEDTDKVWLFPVAGLVLRYEKLLSEKQVHNRLYGSISFFKVYWLTSLTCFLAHEYSAKNIVQALPQGALPSF